MDYLPDPAGTLYLHYLAYLNMQPLAALSPSALDGESFISPLCSQQLNALFYQLIDDLPLTLGITRFSHNAFKTADFERYDVPLPGNFGNAIAKRQAEYLAARICAKTALQQYQVTTLPRMVPGERCPYWPQGWRGSLTHSHGIAAAVIARDNDLQAVGIDIEGWVDVQRSERLAPAILREEELAYWNSLESADSRAKWLTRIFSAKESLYKALYPLARKAFYFHDARAMYDEDNPDRFTMRLEIDLSTELTQGFVCQARSFSLGAEVMTLVAFSADSAR